ncbi:NAD(P)-binding protein [Hypomontagnella monticulosa]|nr:NAD(P)-binding protein [Hypomontagnella monticulosa]
MVKIAIASASSQLAREVLDALVATKRHEIIALVRKDPTIYPSLPGVTWVQTTCQDKAELVRLFKGVETVLSFAPVHLDVGNAIQKRLIDAAVEAGVKRFAPSEWATGVKMELALDGIPWYAGKLEVAHYLEEINKEKKVIEYTRFQVGIFMNYLAHPHKTANHITTMSFLFDLENQQAMLVEGSLDDVTVWTTIQDIATVVARAVDYEGEWPAVGGIAGSRITVGELLRIAESIGRPFTVNWLKKEDVEAIEWKSEWYEGIDLRNAPPERFQQFMSVAVQGILIGISRGAYDVSNEWNKLLPDYEFTQVGDFVKKIWGGK